MNTRLNRYSALAMLALLAVTAAHAQTVLSQPWVWEEGVRASGATVEVASDGASSDLSVVIGPARAADLALLGLRITNRGAEQRRVTVRVAMPAPTRSQAVRYWDGGVNDSTPVGGPQPDRREGADAALFVPLAAVADGDNGLVVGLTPDTNCSYWHPQLNYSLPKASTLTQTIRLVLQPGQTDGFTLCAGRFTGAQYGLMQAAWEAYQQAFPRFFSPTPGVCDNIWGASAEYMAWVVPPNVEPFHRLHVTWDWCYTPFRRTGDIYGREEEWDYKPLATSFDAQSSGMLGNGSYPMAKKSATEFRADRQRYFEQYGLDHGLMFYNLVHWVEKQLALEKFSDSVVIDPNFKTELASWCRFHDVEISTMPFGDSYEKRILGDIERLAQELPLTGYALDVFLNRERNHSEYVNKTPLPGRAWDDHGVYQDIGISMSQLADRLHQVKLQNRPFDRIALVGGNGVTGFHTDATLYELTFYGRDKKNYPLWRMSMGQKPGVCWQGWDIPNILPQWERMSRHDFIKAFWGVTDYTRLKCFQWGIFPTYSNLIGVDRFQQDMPLLVELVKQGWHPLAPVQVKTPQKAYVWPSRYGSGPSNTLVIGSPNEAPVPDAAITVDNRLLGTGNSLYATRLGQPLDQRVQGRQTLLTATLPRRDLLMLRSALALNVDCAATVRETRTPYEIDITAEVTPAHPGTARLEPAIIPQFELQKTELNGEPASPSVSLRAGKNVVHLVYRSKRFHLVSGSLADFPFLSPDNRINFVCVAPEPQRRDYARVIRRLSGYFDYTCRQALKVTDPGTMSVVPTASEPAGRPRVVLTIGGANDGWTIDTSNRTLTLKAASEAEAIRATDALLDALDTRYPYIVPFRGGMSGMYQPVQVKHDMIGKTLGQMLAEEGIQ